MIFNCLLVKLSRQHYRRKREPMLLLDRYRVLIIYLLLRPFLSRLEVSLQIGNNGDVTAIADEGPESGVEQNGYDQ